MCLCSFIKKIRYSTHKAKNEFGSSEKGNRKSFDFKPRNSQILLTTFRVVILECTQIYLFQLKCKLLPHVSLNHY